MNNEAKNQERAGRPEGRVAKIVARVAKYTTAALVLLLLFWFGFTHTVREGDCAVVLRFGAVREEITEAGLYMKLPWPFEKVVTYDARVQYIEPDRLETTTKDKQNIILQSFVVYEISDPVLYHNSVGANGMLDAYMRDQVFSATNSTLGGYNLSALVSLEREEIRIDQIQEEIFSRVQENCLANYGVNVLDVSIMRLSFPDNNLDKVFEHMRAEREGAITKIINAAEEAVNKTKTEAEEDAANKVAEGVTEAAKIKAETEKEVAALYAKAQSANIELYKFLKNLDTIVSSVNSSTVLIVKANEYPFNILTEYSKYMDVEGDKTVIRDLTYILTQLDEADRTALVTAVGALIEDASSKNGVTMP